MQDLILNILMWIITTLSNIFVKPIMLLLTAFIPDMADYIISIKTFLISYVFTPMNFFVRFLYNVTGLSRTIVLFGFTYLTLKITLWVGMRAYKLIIKIWEIVKP